MGLTDKRFYTAYFASVMATGIVSTAMFIYHQIWLSDILLAIGVGLYLVLWYAYAGRLVLAPREMWRNLTDPSTTFGFFTIVAGSNVLAVRFMLAHWVGLSVVFGTIGLVSWAVLFYTVMTALITGPAADLTSVNGGWLIAIVAEQSIATYLASMIGVVPGHVTILFLASATFWAMGLILYLVFIAFIMNRLLFQTIDPQDMQPPYWINMGATAISVLASSRLLAVPVHTTILVTLRPFLEGGTLMFWAWGSWWIPLLVILGIWKYWRGHEPIAYHPAQWSIVFPLGMYGTATTAMSKIQGFLPLHWVGEGFAWISLGAWTLVAVLGLRHMRQRSQVPANQALSLEQ